MTNSNPPSAPEALSAAANQFTFDWFSHNIPLWERFLLPYRIRPSRFLEVGVFEGRSTVWLLQQVLIHPESRLHYIDTFDAGSFWGMPEGELHARFLRNVAPFADKVVGGKGTSQELLRLLPFGSFDFIYIDGSHDAADVLSDAVLAWPLLKTKGLLAFDDYEWTRESDPRLRPKLAIDAFLAVMSGRYSLLHKEYQVWIVKDQGFTNTDR